MYEFERMRRLVLSIDAWLPEGSPTLFVQVSIHNVTGDETPAYWWSNIAVPEAADVRVVAPAARAFHFDYTADLRTIDFPALDGTGRGLAHVSTDRLRGRKLFHRGTGVGGLRRQEWLSGPDARYLEIQGGLARTQLEHLPMPGHTTWTWIEAYGLLEADPASVHGGWDEARRAAGEAVDRLVPPGVLEGLLEAAERQSAPAECHGERLAHGSGWGALEVLAQAVPELDGLPFGEPGAEQRPWAELWRTGLLPASDPPAAPVTGGHWRELLEKHPADRHARYHLGLVRWADGDAEGARRAWTESLELRRTPWALRCLAESTRLAPLRSEAAESVADVAREMAPLLLEAHALAPGVLPLTVELLRALLAAGLADKALTRIDALDPGQRADPPAGGRGRRSRNGPAESTRSPPPTTSACGSRAGGGQRSTISFLPITTTPPRVSANLVRS
ncbi:hypothetical protein HII36_46470 [Nonomuraea sp. NN258]|nr:hypothetical protein [Nonomuraea antri]